MPNATKELVRTQLPLQKEAIQESAIERNWGIELLRILSMLMVVTLHCLGFGGVLDNAPAGSAAYHTAYFLEIACLCSVNVYALITGYVCVKSRRKWARILALWLEVVFWSLLFTILLYFIPQRTFDLRQFVYALFPVMSYRYWYFSAYFCLFLFMPFLNILLHHLTRREHGKLILTAMIAFCGIAVVAQYIYGDIFNVNNGYSFLWLASLYTVGAYFRLYPESIRKLKSYQSLLGYFLCIIAAWAERLIVVELCARFLRQQKYNAVILNYTSPLIVASAIFLLLFFVRLDIRRGKKVIHAISSVSFGVYLIHLQVYVLNRFIVGRFAVFAAMPWYLMLSCTLLAAIAIFAACAALAFVQKYLFILLHIPQLCRKIEECARHTADRIRRQKEE